LAAFLHHAAGMDHPLDLLAANARDLARGLVAQLPFLAVAAVAFACFLLLARLLRGLVRRGLRRYDPSFAEMVARLVHVAVVVLGILVALWIAIPTLQFSEILTSLGVTGLILGFALKDIIENFVAGILILWRHPFGVGDQIRSGAFEGTVTEITFRSTVLRTYDGVRVFIPNGTVFTEPLENFTANATRRSLVALGIDQDSAVAVARRVILKTLAGIDGVLPDPPPAVLFAEVGDFANVLHVLYWTAPPTRFSELTTRSDVTERLYAALPDAGIGFPYPIQTLRLEVEQATALTRRQPAADTAARGRG
jgi:small-conductance mechanosensitive channel